MSAEQKAETARRKAEARRLRILAKSAERLDVVNGLAPKPAAADDDAAAVDPSHQAAVAPVAHDKAAAAVVPALVKEVNNVDAAATTVEESNDSPLAADAAASARAAALDAGATMSTPVESSKGSRRMAAMRRRRYQSKNKPKGEATGGGDEAVAVAKEEEVVDDGKEADNAAVDGEILTKKDDEAAEKSEREETAAPSTRQMEEAKAAPSPTPPPVKSETTITPKVDTTPAPVEEKKEEDQPPQKKYMGVARMRRKLLKEQKAQRLKDIADAEVMGGSNRGRSGADVERELAAEMATMDITASQMRRGGMGFADGSGSNLLTTSINKRKVKWYMRFLPPMKLLPRMFTLLLLFVAGLDLGTQPHRAGGGSPLGASPFQGDLAARDLVGRSGVINLIQHVEPALTKPWEYGVGGRVAFKVGMASSYPPTAMPTAFDGEMVCVGGDFDAAGECQAPKETHDKTGDDSKSKKKKKNKNIIVRQLMEDEFDSSRTRPKGVSHDEEFGDGEGTPNKAPNIDPLFKVDLDDLLANVQLPAPVHAAAKLAIGFHRAWVYYLWTLPTTLAKSILYDGPKNLLGGWITNPPWILCVVLSIRFLTKVLMGNGKKSSISSEKDEGDSESSKDAGGGNSMDMMQKLSDTAKNYATSKFPKTCLFFSTLLKVMKVDMYVVLCGMLIGLVGPLAREDYLTGSGGGERGGGGGVHRPVLGDGEL